MYILLSNFAFVLGGTFTPQTNNKISERSPKIKQNSSEYTVHDSAKLVLEILHYVNLLWPSPVTKMANEFYLFLCILFESNCCVRCLHKDYLVLTFTYCDN